MSKHIRQRILLINEPKPEPERPIILNLIKRANDWRKANFTITYTIVHVVPNRINE